MRFQPRLSPLVCVVWCGATDADRGNVDMRCAIIFGMVYLLHVFTSTASFCLSGNTPLNWDVRFPAASSANNNTIFDFN